MSTVPMKEALATGAWLECQNNKYEFRIKAISFDRVDLNEIDNISRVDVDLTAGRFYIFKFELVNLNKEAAFVSLLAHEITLIDKDGYEFMPFNDDYLMLISNFAAKTSLRAFAFSKANRLNPKLKMIGANAIMLPDEDNEYSIGLKNGTVHEA